MTPNPSITFLPLLGSMADNDILGDLAGVLVGLSLFLLGYACLFGFISLVHYFLTLPMRRAERARLFLDLIELALKRGQKAEETILSLAQNRDLTLGVRFHILAAHIESGLPLGEALKKTPRFLPPQISAILLAGEKLGDLKCVLPAGREILRDRPAGVRSAIHYMLLVVLLFSPIFITVTILIMLFVIPKFLDVANGMGVRLWPESIFVFALSQSGGLFLLETILFLFPLLLTLAYIGGPRLTGWFQFRSFPIVDWIAWRLPWKRKRLQRTFSAMLAVLLDGGVPEPEAVRLAGDCTANQICRTHVRRILAALEQGVKLDEAVRWFDDGGEFRWRLANTLQTRGSFLGALRGWHETLDAKAFQQEEATAHVVTSGLVILNGALVGLIATAMFGIIIAVLKGVLDAT